MQMNGKAFSAFGELQNKKSEPITDRQKVRIYFIVVDLNGIEPSTSRMRTERSPI
jgi:hypothetical protein